MSDRQPSNPWATACLLISLVPVAVFALLLAFEALSHTSSAAFDEALYASVPISGIAALGFGLAARRRPGGRARTIVGLVVGAAEVTVSLIVAIGLATAFDTLGSASAGSRRRTEARGSLPAGYMDLAGYLP